MGLDMYFEGTFSTRAFTERSLDKTKVALDPSFESLLNKDLGEGIKMLGDSMSNIIKFLQKLGGNN